MRNARDHGFLWRISKDGHSSYLYGTVHLGRVDLLYPGPMVLRSLRASNQIALELDPLDTDIMQRLRAAVSVGSDAVLPDQLAERLRSEAERACIPQAALDGMFPELRVATLLALDARGDGLYPDYGIDVLLAGLAHGLKKPVISLESPELQMDAMRS